MNIQKQIDLIDAKIDQITKIRDDLIEAASTTHDILKACEAFGVSIVGVGCKSPDIPSSIKYPFGATGSVFAEGIASDGWPVAWSIVRKAGISGGCGNLGQRQVVAGTKMIDGVYRFIDGVWTRDD